nr:ubiquitin carboxyl-terminal hydrolase 24-like isoform X1 [Ipomoea trifida]
MKNDVEITFGSLDSATLRSVGLLNSNLRKVDYSRGAQPSKVFSKENSKNTCGSTEKASIPVIFSQENGSIGGSDLGYHSTAQEVKPCNKAHQLLSSEGASVTPKESSIKQESTVNVTNLDGVSLDESKDFSDTKLFVPSKLSEIFGGQLKSIVKARGNKASATVQPFLLLHLNICPDPAEVVSASKSVKILELSDIMEVKEVPSCTNLYTSLWSLCLDVICSCLPILSFSVDIVLCASDHKLFTNIMHIPPHKANEDCNCYSFDARKLNEAKCVHKDHVSSV